MPGVAAVDVYGAELVAEELIAVGNRGADMMPVWPRIIEALQDSVEEQYTTRGAHGPRGPWAKADKEWTWYKFNRGWSLEILKATEAMYEALTGKTSDSIHRMSLDRLEFGADLDQFAIHQDPPEDAPFRIRYPIDLTTYEIEWMTRVISRYIAGAFAGAGDRVEGMSDSYYNPKAKRWMSRSSGQFIKGPGTS